MEQYGENHWWEPDEDPRKYAYYQIQEPIWLSNGMDHFHESIELLLGRPVFTHELAISYQDLVQEAHRAWTYQVGVTSDRERDLRVTESINNFAQWSKQNNMPLIIVSE